MFWGMIVQSLAIFSLIWAVDFYDFVWIGVILGIGTALVYPTFINAISDYTHPKQRAESLGVFRFWRDMGYAAGALLTGVIADNFGINASIVSIAVITGISAFIILGRVKDVVK